MNNCSILPFHRGAASSGPENPPIPQGGTGAGPTRTDRGTSSLTYYLQTPPNFDRFPRAKRCFLNRFIPHPPQGSLVRRVACLAEGPAPAQWCARAVG